MKINFILNIVFGIGLIYCFIKSILLLWKLFKYKKTKGKIISCNSTNTNNRTVFTYDIKTESIIDKNLISKEYQNPYQYDKSSDLSLCFNPSNMDFFIYSFEDFWIRLISYIFATIWISFFLFIDIFYNNNITDDTRILSIIIFLVILIGLFLIYNLKLEYNRISNLKIKGIGKTGIIKSFIKTKDHDNHVFYKPVIEFVNENGSSFTFISQMYYTSEKKINSVVGILYDKDCPQFAEINTFWALWGKTVIFIFLASVSIILSLYLFFKFII